MQNYFSLFKLLQQFNIDLTQLNANYRVLQSESHPDRYVTASSAEKLRSLQLATLANEAYQTLKNPANRASYLLQLHNIEAAAQTNTTMPADFLMQQMEWHEILDDAKQAKDIKALERLLLEMQNECVALQTKLVDCFDVNNDLIIATDTTRKLIFIDKVSADVNKAIEQIMVQLEDNS